MNLATGQSAKKEHLSSGPSTACRIRTSGPMKNDKDTFKLIAEKRPEQCCQKCLNVFRRIK